MSPYTYYRLLGRRFSKDFFVIALKFILPWKDWLIYYFSLFRLRQNYIIFWRRNLLELLIFLLNLRFILRGKVRFMLLFSLMGINFGIEFTLFYQFLLRLAGVFRWFILSYRRRTLKIDGSWRDRIVFAGG